MSVASIVEDEGVYLRYGIDDSDGEELKRVFPDAVHPDADKIIPDSILSWNKDKKYKSLTNEI